MHYLVLINYISNKHMVCVLVSSGLVFFVLGLTYLGGCRRKLEIFVVEHLACSQSYYHR